MTIIEYMRQKLTEYPKISEFLAGDDIHIDLVNDGVYCFVIIDKDSKTIDITSQIQGTSYPEGGIRYLK